MTNERNKPAAAIMWWDGGERAITPREKELIEEHGPSSFSIALVLATEQPNYAPPQMAASFRAGQNTEHMQADGYRDAFFELGGILGLSAQPRSPREVWETQMRPALQVALAVHQPGAQVPVGYWFTDDPAKYAMPGSGFHPGSEPPADAIDVVPVYATPLAQGIDLGAGIKAIATERERQLQAEGFTREGDQQYRRGELAKAATAYVQLAAMDLEAGTRDHIAWQGPAAVWPWAWEWWKPVDARRDLVRAGALIAAQIDLIDSQRDAAPGVGNG